MKLAFMSFSCPDADIKEFIGIAKKYGYGGIEPRINAGHKHGIEPGVESLFLRHAKELAIENGIKICCIATSCMFANPETVADNINQAKQAVDIASEAGASVIRVFGGGIPHGMEREKSAGCITEALIKLADYAESHNINICLETHDDWCDPKWVAKIMCDVSRDSIAVNWDIMHPVLTAKYTMSDAFKILKKWIKHVHVHDGINDNGLVFKPIGEGAVDHAAALSLLREHKYQGFISGEWIVWESYEIHLPREIAKLKSLI